MEKVADEVNEHARQNGRPDMSVDEVAMGFIKVANETMCRPIRALTQMRVPPPPGAPGTPLLQSLSLDLGFTSQSSRWQVTA